MCAVTKDSKVARIYHESVFPRGRSRQCAEEVLWRFEHCFTRLTDQMAVSVRGEMVGRRTMTEVRVKDDAESFEVLKIAVNGRKMDIGRGLLNLGGYFFGGAMNVIFE
jgi:hypothetical protein